MSKISEDTPESIPVVDALCLGHQISLCCDDMISGVKSEIDVVKPLFATQKICNNFIIVLHYTLPSTSSETTRASSVGVVFCHSSKSTLSEC